MVVTKFPITNFIFQRLKSVKGWFFNKPFYNGLLIILLLPLLLPFAFLLGIYNTPPPFISMIFFNVIVEIALIYYLVFLIISHGRKSAPYFTNIHLLLIILFVITLATALLGLDFPHSFWGNINRADGIFFLLHLYTYVFLLTWIIKDKHQWQAIFKLSVFIGFVVSVLSIVEKIYPQLIYPYIFEPPVINLSFGNENYLAHFLLILLFPAIYLFINSKNKARFFYSAVLILSFFSLILTQSVSAIGLAVLALIFFGFKTYGRRAIGPVLIFLALLVIGAGTLIIGPQHLLYPFSRSIRSRFLMSKIFLDSLKNYLITGVGWDNIDIAYYKYYKPYMNFFGSTIVDKAHNIIVEYLVAGGLFGLSAFLAFWGYIWIKLKKVFRQSKHIIYLIFLFLFTANFLFLLFNFNTIISQIYLYLLLAGAIIYLNEPKIFLKFNKTDYTVSILLIPIIMYSLGFFNLKPFYSNYKRIQAASSLNYYLQARYGLTKDSQEIIKYLDTSAKYIGPYYGARTKIAMTYSEIPNKIKVDQNTAKEIKLKAKALHRQEIAKHPWDPNNYLYLTQLMDQTQLSNNQKRQIREYFKQARASSAQHGHTLFRQAVFELHQGNILEAAHLFNQLSQTNYSKISLFYLGLIKILSGQKQKGEVAILTSLLPSKPKLFSLNYIASLAQPGAVDLERLNKIYQETKNQDQLPQLYQSMIIIQPKNSELYKQLIIQYLKLGMREQAEHQAEIAVKIFPEQAFMFKLLLYAAK